MNLTKVTHSKKARVITAVIIVLLTIIYLFLYRPARKLYADAQIAVSQAKELKSAAKNKNLEQIKNQIDLLELSLQQIENDTQKFKFIRF